MRTFLLTGANGFVGKTTLWFLLNRFPENQLDKIYVIVRSRGNINAVDRFNQSFLTPFPELEQTVKDKVVVVDAHLTKKKSWSQTSATPTLRANGYRCYPLCRLGAV